MSNPTKADLAKAVTELTERNRQLLDTLAAVSELAASVPVAVYEGKDAELRRARDVLMTLGTVTAPRGSWGPMLASGNAAAWLRVKSRVPLTYRPLELPVVAEPEPFAADIDRINAASRM